MTKEQEIELGKKHGFIPVADTRRGYGWPYFKKVVPNGVLTVWMIQEGWQTSVLNNGYYMNHKKFPTLEEALKRDD
jgi:hypothetical protein